ncbi:MAG: hypothetical protein QS99_C0008G0002 [archaeon GW2011_AR4]|nr:MAG: hypothetical protein QS99_C0008G0002 [archaeon GW2011_AR4]
MKKKILWVILLFFCIAAVSGSVMDDVSQVKDKVGDFIDNGDNVVIVEGQYASYLEKKMFLFLKDASPDLADVPLIREDDFRPGDETGKIVVLIGGPRQNMITAMAVADPVFEQESDDLSLGSVTYLDSGEQKMVVFSDRAGFSGLAKTGPYNSPLRKIIPVEYVPAAAAAIGFSLIWLWSLFGKIILEAIQEFFTDKVMNVFKKKKKVKDQARTMNIKGLEIKYREIFAILIAASIFAFGLAYTYLSPVLPVKSFLLAALIVNILIYLIRHLTRLVMDKRLKAHSEYVMWWFGALITIITAWLGNVFSLAGTTFKGDEENVAEGRIAFIITIITFVAFIIFWLWNFFMPSLVTQITMILLFMGTYLEILPIEPFEGKNIRAWNKKAWWIIFIPLTVLYVIGHLLI